MNERRNKKPRCKLGSALLLGMLAVIILFGAVSLFNRIHPAQVNQQYYARALKEASTTQSVVVKGIPYLVEDGAVYRSGTIITGNEAAAPLLLAYEKTVAERSPLIALPGTDPSRLDAAAQQLEETAQELAGLQKDPRTQALVRDSLYPVDFLQKAAALERARQTFLASGSDVDARSYQEDAMQAAQAFQSGLYQYERGFVLTVPSSAPPYVMVRNYTDYDIVLSIIGQLRAGMYATSDELARRADCFSGIASACDPKDTQLPALVVPPAQPPLPASAMKEVDANLLRPPVKDKLSGSDLSQEPYLELSSSGCEADLPIPHIFILRIAPLSTSTTYKNPLMIGLNRLIDATQQESVPFFKYFADHGVTYVSSSPFVYYECVNYTHDAGTLLGMDAVRAYALTSALSGSVPSLGSQVAPMERSFLSASHAQPITEHDTTLYASLAQQAAYQGALSEKETAQAFDLALAIEDGSAGYDNQIFNITQIEQTNARLYKEGVPVGLDAPDLFYTRSALTTLFMTTNPSVTGAHDTLYPEAPASTDQPYLYYSLLSPEEQRTADIDQEFYTLLHDDPSFVPPVLSR